MVILWPVYFRIPNCFLYAFPKFTAKDSTFFLITLWWCKCGRIHFIISFRNETDIKDLFRSICKTLIIIIPLIQMYSDLSEFCTYRNSSDIIILLVSSNLEYIVRSTVVIYHLNVSAPKILIRLDYGMKIVL